MITQHLGTCTFSDNSLAVAFSILLSPISRPKMVQLTDLESELNALDSRGFSVLHYTCLHNLSALVPVLIERGADVNLRTGDGQDQVLHREMS